MGPILKTPEYSSRAQLAGVPEEKLIVNDVEATEPPAPVDHISDLTAVPLLTKAWRAQIDPPSMIELMEDVVLPSEHTATIVLPLLLEYAIGSEAGALAEPVLLLAPPTGEITVAAADVFGEVEKVKLADVVVPPESAEMTA